MSIEQAYCVGDCSHMIAPYKSTDNIGASMLRHHQQLAYPPKTVYLAGPITGLSYDEARNSWRTEFAGLLPPHIHALSPMRAKEFLKDEQVLDGVTGKGEYDDPTAKPKGIVVRDSNDIRNADAVIVNFTGAEKVSIGTVWEIGHAAAHGIPIILIMEKNCHVVTGTERSKGSNPHCHAFVTESAGYWVETVRDAAKIVTHLLTPGI